MDNRPVSFSSILEKRIRNEIETARSFAEKCELRMETLSNRRDIFGRIKDRDAYEEEQCWAYWHRATANICESLLELATNSKEEYYRLQDSYKELKKSIQMLEE